MDWMCNTFTAISFISRATELLTSIWVPIHLLKYLRSTSSHLYFSMCSHEPSISVWYFMSIKAYVFRFWCNTIVYPRIQYRDWIIHNTRSLLYSKVSKFSKMVRVLWSNLHTRLCTDVRMFHLSELFGTRELFGRVLFSLHTDIYTRYTQRRWFWFDVKLYLVFVL